MGIILIQTTIDSDGIMSFIICGYKVILPEFKANVGWLYFSAWHNYLTSHSFTFGIPV